MIHTIKIRESFANAVNCGDKTFEVRKNDRGYQKGDTVRFIVLYDSDGCEMLNHPLMKKEYEITYVLSGYGIENGYCVFGIKPKERRVNWDDSGDEAEVTAEDSNDHPDGGGVSGAGDADRIRGD